MLNYSKEHAIEILYNAFLEKGERLQSKEIVAKKIYSTEALTKIFGTTRTKDIWEEVDSHYKINTGKTEKQKLELINEMQDMYKKVQPFNNKTVERCFRNKMERFFGSWVEAMLQSGLKPNSYVPDTLSDKRKDLILENLISIVLSDGEYKIPSKNGLSKHKNIPNARMCETIYGVEWKELIVKLGLDRKMRKEFNKLSNSQVLNIFKNEMKNNKSMTLSEYSFNLSKESFPFILYMEKFEVNWKYMMLLFKNDFKDVRKNKFYNKDDLLDILTFKYLLNGRQLKAIEIDNDLMLPTVNMLMSTEIFSKGIYEIWLMAEECSKTYY